MQYYINVIILLLYYIFFFHFSRIYLCQMPAWTGMSIIMAHPVAMKIKSVQILA